MKTATIRFRVYGRAGHRQRVSFEESRIYDWTRGDDVRVLKLMCSDVTHTNEYVDVIITRKTEEECWDEFRGQLTDGIFENSMVGYWEVVK